MVRLLKIIPAFFVFFNSSFFLQSQTTETVITETINADGIPAGELLKRAVLWVKTETQDFAKSSPVTAANKAECSVNFTVQPEPDYKGADYAGRISMRALIECSNNKYRLNIFQLKHTSKSGKTSAGPLHNPEPECGKSVMPEEIYSKLQRDGKLMVEAVRSDIIESMKLSSSEREKED